MTHWEIVEFVVKLVAAALSVRVLIGLVEMWLDHRAARAAAQQVSSRSRGVRMTFDENAVQLRATLRQIEQSERTFTQQMQEIKLAWESARKPLPDEEIAANDLPEAIEELQVAADLLEEQGYDEPAKLLRDHYRMFATRWIQRPMRDVEAELQGVRLSVIRAGGYSKPTVDHVEPATMRM